MNHIRKYYDKKDIFIYGFISTIYGLIVTLFLLIYIYATNQELHQTIFCDTVSLDVYVLLVKVFIVLLTIIFLLGSLNKFLQSDFDMIEYPTLICFSTLFLLVLLSAHNLMTLFLAIEGLSLTLYMLTVFNYQTMSIEAAVKYFVTGAVSSGFLIFGILVIYAKTGSFDYKVLSYTFLHLNSYTPVPFHDTFLSLALVSFVLGFIIKLGAFPCHM